MSSAAPSPTEGLAEDPRDGRDPPRRKLALATGQRLKQMNQHHPYRIELLDLTPVSVSVLWSTRPPPLSAIPPGIVTTPLRQRFQTRALPGGTSSPPAPSATASAVSTLPTSSSSNLKSVKLSYSKQHSQASEALSHPGSARGSPTPIPANDAPIHRLAEGLIATRSLNRKVTKIRLRGPSSIPAASSRRVSNGSATIEGRSATADNDGSGLDDSSTALDDDGVSGSEGSDSGFEGDSKASNMVHVFENRVSVTVNGSDWPHVLMGERGSHEAIVVIFGLQPESDYDVQFEVKDGLEGLPESVRLPLRTRAERDRTTEASSHGCKAAAAAVRPSSPSPLGKSAVSADDETEVVNVQKKALLQAELEASEGMKSEMLAELRKARKETSKAESALRHEIESIKRHIERMSSTDHRSKQKVLALQEAIKQTTAHAKDIHAEAEEIEGEYEDWEQKEAALSKELEELKKQIDAEDADVEAQLQADEAEIAAVEKELKAAEAAVRSKEAERDGFKDDKLPGLEAEITKLQSQIKDVLVKPLHARRGGHGAHRGGGRGSGGATHMIPSQALPRGNKATPGLGHPSGVGGRGGKAAIHGPNPRATLGPASQGVLPPATFQGPFKTFVPSASQGNANTAARPFRSNFCLRPDGGAGSVLIHAPFDPTTNEPPYSAGLSHLASQEGPFGAAHSSAFGAMGGGYGGGYFPDLNATSLDYGGEPSPSGQDRRSSLPLPQLFGRGPTNSVLNPKNPEFIPSASSANASPVMLKANIGSAPNSKPATTAPAPAFNTVAPCAASLEHSPTSSSRFAFPLARHGAGVISKLSTTGAAPSPIGSDRTPAPVGEPVTSSAISTSSQLFPPGAGATGPFSRTSPLLAGSAPGATTTTSPLAYGSSSPRFGSASLSTADDTPVPQDTGFATSKFGPLDYDPGLDDFGPGLNLGTASRFGQGTGAAASALPFGSNAYPLFGASDTWTPPVAPPASSLGSGGSAVGSSLINASTAAGPSLWAVPSPPMGGGLNMSGIAGDIWSPPTLSSAAAPSSLRTKLSLGDFKHRTGLGPIGTSHDIGPGFGSSAGASGFLHGASGIASSPNGGNGLGPLRNGSRFMNMSAPVSPTSPHHQDGPGPDRTLGLGQESNATDDSDMEMLAEVAQATASLPADDEPSDQVKPTETDGTLLKEPNSPLAPSFADVAAAAKKSTN
ncbi:hypothetical protein ACQY0O_000828 [Thecaphora frezii]